MKTLYDRLGVTPQASANAIQQAFYRMAKKLDPRALANLLDPNAQREYRAVQDAYRTLADPTLRRQYDESLNEHRPQVIGTALRVPSSLRVSG